MKTIAKILIGVSLFALFGCLKIETPISESIISDVFPDYALENIEWEVGSFTKEYEREAIVGFKDANQMSESLSDQSEIWLLRHNGENWEAIEKLYESDSSGFKVVDIDLDYSDIGEIYITGWQNNGWGNFSNTGELISIENGEKKTLFSVEGITNIATEEENPSATTHSVEFKNTIQNEYMEIVDTVNTKLYENFEEILETINEVTYEFDGEKYVEKETVLIAERKPYEGYSLETELIEDNYTVEIYTFGPGAYEASTAYYYGEISKEEYYATEEQGIIVIFDKDNQTMDEFYTSFEDIFFDGPGGFTITIDKFEDEKLYFIVDIGYDGLAGTRNWYIYDNETKDQKLVRTDLNSYGYLDGCNNQLCSRETTEIYEASLAENFSEELERSYYVRQGGNWFSIECPRTFTVIGKEAEDPNEGFIGLYDGLLFVSPDETVEFYIYSPMWSGETYWTDMWEGETEVSRNEELIESSVYNQQTEEVIFETDEYTRISTEISNIMPEDGRTVDNHVFGIKYTSDEAYLNYEEDYNHFMESLEQYLD